MKPKSAASPQPEYQLKHRLVGAVIMVTLAVLIIPWLLSEQEIESGIDVFGENPFRAGNASLTITGLVVENADKAPDEVLAEEPGEEFGEEPGEESGEESNEEPGTVLVKIEPTTQSTIPDATPGATSSTTPSTTLGATPTLSQSQSTTQTALPDATGGENEQLEKPPVPATSSSGWVVKAGTYSEQANADSVYAKLKNRGFSPNKASVRIALKDSDATQIWLGPYAKRETAEEVSRGIENIIGEKGFVTRHKP